MAAIEASYKRRAAGNPNLAASQSTGRFRPVSAMPPFRELAPHPTVWRSSTATEAPRFASASAAERPVNPAPTIATSTRFGKQTGGCAGTGATVSDQQDCSSNDRSMKE
jgi:hypothetical protein